MSELHEGYPWRKKRIDTYIVLGIASFMINVVGVAVPLALLQVYNRIIPNQGEATLSILVLGVLGALAVDAALRTLRTLFIGWYGARFEHGASCDVFRRILQSEPRDLERIEGAQQLERMSAIHTLGELYSGQALLAIFDLPFLLIYLFLVYTLGGWLVLVPVVSLILVTILSGTFGTKLLQALTKDSEQTQRRFGFITETLARIHSVKSLAMESLMLRRYEMLQNANLKQTYDIIFLGATLPAVSSMASQITASVVLAFGSWAVIDGQLTTGGLAACLMLSGRTLQPLQTLVAGWTRLQAIRLARKDVDLLLQMPQRKVAEGMTDSSAELQGRVSLQEVRVGAEGTPAVLRDLTLEVAPGECVAIIGESGSGKTTLLKLIAGRLLPDRGTVNVDGSPAHALPDTWRKQVAYVPQQGTLFNGTILQNLTMFDESRREAALRVAASLGLDQVVSRMPKGYATVVGDGASDALAAGVVQRISIARILALEPRILLFDEANMAIDSAGDGLLRTCLEELKGRCTIILISLRPSLLRIADRSFKLGGGTLEALASYRDGLDSINAVLPAETAGMQSMREEARIRALGDGLGDEPSWTRFLDELPVANAYSRCLKLLLTGVKWSGPSRQLAEALPHFSDSIDLTDLCNTMANLQYTHRMAEGVPEDIDPRLMPYLFVSAKGRPYVVVGRDGNGQPLAFDGEDNVVRPGSGIGTGQAFFFTPPNPDAVKPKSWVTHQIDRFRSLIWMIMGLTILGNVLATATPLYTKAIYDNIIPSGSVAMGFSLLAGTLLAILVDWLLRLQRARILAYIGAKAERVLGSGILERILALPASFTERVAVGVQVSRIKTLEVIRDMFVGPLAFLYYDAPSTLLFLIVLGLISPDVILFMIGLIVALALLAFALMPYLRRTTANSSKVMGQRQAFLTEALSRVQLIQSTHADAIWYQRFRDLSGKATMASFLVSQLTSLLTTLAQTLTMMASVGVMTITAKGVMAGTLSSGTVMAAMMLTWRIFAPIQTTFLGIARMVQVFNSIGQIDRLMEMKGERDFAAHASSRTLKGAVGFSRVSFRYSSDSEPALVGVSFRVPEGSVVAVIGANGSGKSTLLKMILGLYQPQAGSVLIDEGDIRQLDPIDLRQNVSYLPQNCDIFFGTVAQNLRLANPVASDAELEEACGRAGLLEEIRRMPEGFGTRLNESRSEKLSTGFKQRLSLARAYLKKSKIMLFDEPGNNLDAESERYFREAILESRGKVTSFIVTHRPSHMQMADVVLYLEGGYLRAAGKPEDVRKMLPQSFI
ncbi:MAG: ATP-binding cassette domain-containing protein [Magnetococcales bacterium]|nr:ATP-binding cassette domain-containing protein [Magnetococcales bacterium]